MIRSGPRLAAVGLAAASWILSGCGGAKDAPKTVPAAGVVTYNGNPVPNASLTFMPETSTARAADASTDSSGKFAARTSQSAPGLMPGSYKVIVQAFKKNPAEIRPGDLAKEGGDANLAVPKKYTDAKTTDAKIVVEAGGSKDLKIDLKD